MPSYHSLLLKNILFLNLIILFQPNILIADNINPNEMEIREGATYKIHDIIISDNINHFSNELVKKTKDPIILDSYNNVFAYSLKMDDHRSADIITAEENIRHLKSLGLSCRITEESDTYNESPNYQFNILCGMAKIISDLHNTIIIAQNNHLSFHIILTSAK